MMRSSLSLVTAVAAALGVGNLDLPGARTGPTGTPIPVVKVLPPRQKRAVDPTQSQPPRGRKGRGKNASLPSIKNGLKPMLQDTGGHHFLFPNGQIRRQVGKGHSKAERQQRRQEKKERTAGIVNETELKAEYAKWRAEMTPEERAVARRLKVLQPLGTGGVPKARRGQEVDVDFRDPADLPEARDERTAVDDMEPQSAFSVLIENLDCQEITAGAEDFGAGLSWAFSGPDLRDMVKIGERALGVIFLMQPDLVTGDERKRAVAAIGYDDLATWPLVPWGGDCHQCLATGELFGRVLAWVRQGKTISEIGERLCLVGYVVRPTIMGSPTLHQLGEVMNKTRQAKDKLLCCLRDTFSGIRAAAQRGEVTRDRCAASH